MNEIIAAFSGLLSLTGLLAFLAGVVLTMAYYRVSDIVRMHNDPSHRARSTSLRPLVMLWSLVFIVMGYVGVQEEIQAITVRKLSVNTQHCELEFQRALLKRDELTAQDGEFARQEREALAGWLTAMVVPPPEIARLHTTDPGFQEYAVAKTNDFYRTVNAIEVEREKNLAERARHPLPEPQCGRE